MILKKILITGFDPFDGEMVNPAWEAVNQIENKIKGVELITFQIPTSFKKAAKKLIEKIEEEEPDVVICVGQAGGSYQVEVERVAINIADGRIPDNDGHQPIDEAIVSEGKNAYFSSLPIKKIIEALKASGTPAAVSNSAGTYVCNYVLYSLLHYIESNGKRMKGGFIHVPYLPEQVLDKMDMPYMELARIKNALEIIIEKSAE